MTFKVGDRVKVNLENWGEAEGVGVVRRVHTNPPGVTVETICNMWRNYPDDMFIPTDEPLGEWAEK